MAAKRPQVLIIEVAAALGHLAVNNAALMLSLSGVKQSGMVIMSVRYSSAECSCRFAPEKQGHHRVVPLRLVSVHVLAK